MKSITSFFALNLVLSLLISLPPYFYARPAPNHALINSSLFLSFPFFLKKLIQQGHIDLEDGKETHGVDTVFTDSSNDKATTSLEFYSILDGCKQLVYAVERTYRYCMVMNQCGDVFVLSTSSADGLYSMQDH